MATTFSNLLYHIVYSTKNRIPLIHADLREPLYEYIGGIIRGEGGILLEIGGVPDHVHILAKFKTDIAVSEMLKKIKGKSSKWANDRPDRREYFDWQDGYAAFSVSESLVPTVRRLPPQSGGASQEGLVQGRVDRAPQEAPDCVRREIPVGLREPQRNRSGAEVVRQIVQTRRPPIHSPRPPTASAPLRSFRL
jgi:putative transposase